MLCSKHGRLTPLLDIEFYVRVLWCVHFFGSSMLSFYHLIKIYLLDFVD